MLEYATSLQSLLPPRPGGTLALLEAAPGADVVVCAHSGFEGSASLLEIWKGALLHKAVRVKFWRTPSDAIPRELDARTAWLLDEWQHLDAWVEAQKPHQHQPCNSRSDS